MHAGHQQQPVLIVGAGPTGLGAAWRLEELGFTNYLLLEGEGAPGGLSASVVDAHGFTWDLGGHVQFSHYRYYDDVLDQALGSAWLNHERESWVWIRKRFVPYPFQYNIQRLDPTDRDAALRGLQEAAARPAGERPAQFREWILRTFGEGIAGLFMLPYNEKVWGYPAERMDWSWIGERVAVPDVARVRRNIETGQDDVSWGPNNTFRFPERGGTGAIWRAVAQRLPAARFRYGCRVARVDAARRLVILATGETLPYGALISTLPLDQLTTITDGLSVDAREHGRAMLSNTVHVLGIGLRGGKPASLGQKCWMYFPEANSPYYRVTVFSHYSPHHVPDGEGYWSLMAEVCESPHRPLDRATLEAWTRRALLEDRLIEPDAEVVSFWHRVLPRGYPVPFLGRDTHLRALHAELEPLGVYSRGRFGGWKYEVANQDHSFMQGVEVADRLMRGTTEVTYYDPARANSGEFLRTSAPRA